jgi:hypothetical protein
MREDTIDTDGQVLCYCPVNTEEDSFRTVVDVIEE